MVAVDLTGDSIGERPAIESLQCWVSNKFLSLAPLHRQKDHVTPLSPLSLDSVVQGSQIGKGICKIFENKGFLADRSFDHAWLFISDNAFNISTGRKNRSYYVVEVIVFVIHCKAKAMQYKYIYEYNQNTGLSANWYELKSE